MAEIDDIRAEIADVDKRMMKLISERIRCAERIAAVKMRDGLPVRDADAAKKVIDRYVEYGRTEGISEGAMTSIAEALIGCAEEAEEKVIRKLNDHCE